MENYELIDNTDENQYEFHVGKYIPKIEYIKTNNGEIYLTHTEVPVVLEGQGIGSQLAEKVLADVRSFC
jgi:predicted GNAT family acetyltransferase